MSMCRVCVYHFGQDNISKSPGICGEALACMSWERIRFQVDVIAGDGNKACYLATPKAGGCPTYEVSLLQFWIDRMIHTATQARIKNYGKAPAVRVKHLISCSYKDLAFLAKTLRVLEESQPTLIFLNWPRNWECWRLLRDVHMSMGTRKVSLWGGHHQWFWWSRPHGLRWRIFFFSQWSVFILWPRHRHGCPNSHWCTQPASCSLTPFWHELETEACLCSSSKEDATGGGKKDIQKSKKRKGQGFGDGPLLLDESWDNWDGLGTWTQDSNTGYGDSSSSTAWVWRSKNRWVYTSSKRRR